LEISRELRSRTGKTAITAEFQLPDYQITQITNSSSCLRGEYAGFASENLREKARLAMTADEILGAQTHRPFPMPQKPWVMRQEWHNLLFAHWEIDPNVLRRLVPQHLNLDLWHERAYVAVAPFVIRRLRPRGMSSLPVLSHFPEINVRTYVEFGGIPGVFFFSLDAANLSAVFGARAAYHLPYYAAHMRVKHEGDRVCYESRRFSSPREAEFRATYGPNSGVLAWRPPHESLERFLAERYCLYSVRGGRTYRVHIHHLPWPLQPAVADIQLNTMTSPLHLQLPQSSFFHFARFLDVLVWWPEKVR
jgi:uncharacterized protein